MGEIDRNNFENELPNIEEVIKKAKFFGIDLEFSALYPLSDCKPSLFDDPKQRYHKLRKNVEQTIPIQIGLTAFYSNFNRNIHLDSFEGHCYRFYLKPATFCHVKQTFVFESSTLEFLSCHKFDFNKFAYNGIPYLSKLQEDELRNLLQNNEIMETNSSFSIDQARKMDFFSEKIRLWCPKANVGETLEVELDEYLRGSIEMKYFIHEHFRNTYNEIWTHEKPDCIVFEKVDSARYEELRKQNRLDEELLGKLKGFRGVYDLLVASKKPIVGHNVLMDLLILIRSFEGYLPESYTDFKKLTTRLFPVILDTKHISYCLRRELPKSQAFDSSDLPTLFEYFKNGHGRFLSAGLPINRYPKDVDGAASFHDAAFDSYCTGYVFIRMALFKVYAKRGNKKNQSVTSTELLKAVEEFINRVNVIRCSSNHMNLDGDDPETSRPPLLVIEHADSKNLNLKELGSVLSAYGDVEIKPFGWTKGKAIVTTENYTRSKALVEGLRKSSKYKVRTYSFLRHSRFMHAFIWSSIGATGLSLIWFLNKNMRST